MDGETAAMIQFLRRWYVVVALVWFLGGIAAINTFARSSWSKSYPYLFLTSIFVTLAVPAVLMASRGMKETTTGKVFASFYAVVLVPTGLLALYADVTDNISQGWVNRSWINTWVWFQLMLEGGFLVAPVVLFFSFIFAFVVNLFADGDAGIVEIDEQSHRKPHATIIDPVTAITRATIVPREISTSETPTIFLHYLARQTGPFTLSQVQAMLHRGDIGREAFYWSEGMSNWESVVDLSDQPIE